MSLIMVLFLKDEITGELGAAGTASSSNSHFFRAGLLRSREENVHPYDHRLVTWSFVF